ncbi:hypothetical protein BCT41_10345 [Vibrio splendidus]|uniref:AbrB/MazE/SpoVT family DNA-binding domain-containing protein n=1 Tax=Vibrio splendidus TaxID=29497 RepID=UPI000C85137B|nr:AbrB/MazE/SpoVT family DNA-binding domain-containing protein [Vibrio splendidus]PMN01384.1 hypothetical protein BCT41_10345 [Vibrio splendidus]
METILIEIEGSTGVIIPEELLAEMQLKAGSKVTLIREDNGVFVKLSNGKSNFDIRDLIAKTDFESQRNDPELKAWQTKLRSGREGT